MPFHATITSISEHTTEWGDWRSKGVGASDLPKILGISPYMSPWQLWKIKTGQDTWESDDYAKRRGRRLEATCRALAQESLGVSLSPLCIQHPTDPWARASLDGIDFECRVMAELKASRFPIHVSILKGEMPEEYMPQVQWQMLVSGLEECWFCNYSEKALVAGTPDQFATIKVEADRTVQRELLCLARNFKNSCELSVWVGDEAEALTEKERAKLFREENKEAEAFYRSKLDETKALQTPSNQPITAEMGAAG